MPQAPHPQYQQQQEQSLPPTRLAASPSRARRLGPRSSHSPQPRPTAEQPPPRLQPCGGSSSGCRLSQPALSGSGSIVRGGSLAAQLAQQELPAHHSREAAEAQQLLAQSLEQQTTLASCMEQALEGLHPAERDAFLEQCEVALGLARGTCSACYYAEAEWWQQGRNAVHPQLLEGLLGPLLAAMASSGEGLAPRPVVLHPACGGAAALARRRTPCSAPTRPQRVPAASLPEWCTALTSGTWAHSWSARAWAGLSSGLTGPGAAPWPAAGHPGHDKHRHSPCAGGSPQR